MAGLTNLYIIVCTYPFSFFSEVIGGMMGLERTEGIWIRSDEEMICSTTIISSLGCD